MWVHHGHSPEYHRPKRSSSLHVERPGRRPCRMGQAPKALSQLLTLRQHDRETAGDHHGRKHGWQDMDSLRVCVQTRLPCGHASLHQPLYAEARLANVVRCTSRLMHTLPLVPAILKAAPSKRAKRNGSFGRKPLPPPTTTLPQISALSISI